ELLSFWRRPKGGREDGWCRNNRISKYAPPRMEVLAREQGPMHITLKVQRIRVKAPDFQRNSETMATTLNFCVYPP
ncbi:MAG TPA: hypothetical protein PLC40_06945, partial [Candidatus Hydrogenedentes bacterium]|nr:hypothetical protein [Candidatus Hydrogenedentota bacterium]